LAGHLLGYFDEEREKLVEEVFKFVGNEELVRRIHVQAKRRFKGSHRCTKYIENLGHTIHLLSSEAQVEYLMPVRLRNKGAKGSLASSRSTTTNTLSISSTRISSTRISSRGSGRVSRSGSLA
jgi:hypothetical protein